MHNPNKQAVVDSVKNSSYARLFEWLFGKDAFLDAETAYDYVAEAIAEYERSGEVCRFSSKYDLYLAGRTPLTDQEMHGLTLFTGAAKCSNCHATSAPAGQAPLFTSFGYQNTGAPRNPALPFYSLPPELNPDGTNYVDLGLGGILKATNQNGRVKIPTLRNVAITPPYMHNGVFTSLTQVVHFNNTRDVGNWPPPEVPQNVHRHMPPMPGTFGQLGLTAQDVDDLVAFLTTLTDGYTDPQGNHAGWPDGPLAPLLLGIHQQDGPEVWVCGETDRHYVIETSRDLTTWQAWTNTPSFATLPLSGSSPVGTNQYGFYRAGLAQ